MKNIPKTAENHRKTLAYTKTKATVTGRCRKINYDNIKKILILQSARLSESLQSYQKPILEYHLWYASIYNII